MKSEKKKEKTIKKPLNPFKAWYEFGYADALKEVKSVPTIRISILLDGKEIAKKESIGWGSAEENLGKLKKLFDSL